jgi:osmoprotectant transport system permease protein
MNAFFDYIAANAGELARHFGEHLLLVGIPLLVATPLGVAVGSLLARPEAAKARVPIFYLFGLGQTVPSLALLALAVGFLGIGPVPAATAIFLYALLPIVRNTTTGILAVPHATIDAARGVGMTRGEILRHVELPLALPYVMAGLRTATVVSISAGTLADLIGGGGMGTFIFSGIALFRPEVMLAGAIPVTLLALAADWGLGRAERRLRRGH